MRPIELHPGGFIQGSARYKAMTAEEWVALRDRKADVLSAETADQIAAHNRAVRANCGAR